MATPAATLAILVHANTSQASSALHKTDRQLKTTANTAHKTTGAFKKLALGAAAAGGAYAAIHQAKKAISVTEDLAKTTLSLHKNLGLSVESASEFAAVLKARGVETTKVNMAFGTLSKQVRSAGDGSAKAAKNFTELGISQKELAHLKPEQLMGKLADGMKKLGPGTERTAIGMTLFGRGWQQILPILRDGSGAMQHQLDTAKKYGATFGGKTIKSMEQWIRAQREAKIATMGLQVSFATTVVPTLTKGIQAASQAVLHLRNRFNDLKKGGKSTSEALGIIFQEGISKLGDVFAKVTPHIADAMAKAAPKAVRAFFNAFRNSGLWGKLIIAGFLLKKMGGLGAFTSLGGRAGGAMATGAATSFGGRMKSRIFGMGKMFLGASLIAGIADGITAKDVGGIGNRIQRGLSTATFGLVPDPKTISEKVGKLQASIAAALRKGGKNMKLPGIGVVFEGGAAGKKAVKMIGDLKHVRQQAERIFGKGVQLKASVRKGDPERIERTFREMANFSILSVRDLRKATDENMTRIARSMHLNSKEGRAAVRKNFRGALLNVQQMMESGEISSRKGMKTIAALMRRGSKRGKDALGDNFGLAVGLIRKFMSDGKGVTAEGMAMIESIFAQEARSFGLSAKAAKETAHRKAFVLQGGSDTPRSGRASGGWIGAPGEKGRDAVPTLLGRGEAVLNRHQQPIVNAGLQAIGVGGLPELFQKVQTPHYLARGGTVGRQVVQGPDSSIKTVAQGSLDTTREYVNKALENLTPPAGDQTARGVKGVGSYRGLAMANWVIGALQYAARKGVSPQPTSGYRSHATNVAHGRTYFSEHEGTQYPHGAVDFGGFTTGYEAAQSVIHATADYKYPLISYISSFDKGHTSGTGHAKGGFVKAARGLSPSAHAAASRRYPGRGFNWAYKNYPRGGHAALSEKQVRMVAEMAGFNPGRALQMAQIAHGESTFQPGADGGLAGTPGPPGYGLWQTTPGAWGGSGNEPIYRKFNSLGGRTGMFTPIKSAKMSKFMYGQSGLSPWKGTRYLESLKSGVSSVLSANARTGGGAPSGPKPLSKKRQRATAKLLKRVRGIGLSKTTETKLKNLRHAADVYAEFAERASQLTGEGGSAKVFGGTEGQWLQKELETLFKLRNLLIKAEESVVKKREHVSKLLRKYGTKEKLDRALTRAKKHPRRNRKLIRYLTAFKDNFRKIIPALKKSRSGLNTRRGELLADLDTVQGIGSPTKALKTMPAVGVLGGEIFSTQMSLKALGEKTSVTDSSTTTDDSGRADMLAELLRQANLRTAVSQRQYDVLKNLPFAGSYAQGGIVPGPVGRPMSAVVHGGEAIGAPGGVDVHLHFAPGTEWLKDFVKVEIKQETRKQARQGSRGLPGGR